MISKESITKPSQKGVECDIPLCENKATNHCKFCGRYVCDFHLKPKLTGSRSFISSLTDPYLITKFKEDDESEDGHSCPEYYEKFMIEYEKEKKKKNAPIDIGPWLPEIVGDPNSCNVLACDNKPIHTCKICRRRYCGYHASRKRYQLEHLGGHVCVR